MMVTGQRLRRNVWGRFYITDECDGCGICASYAPANFDCNEDGAYYYVIQQPYDSVEEDALLDAIEACPKRCIRADGERD